MGGASPLLVSTEILQFLENLKEKIATRQASLQSEEDYQTGLRLKASGLIPSALSRFSKAAHLKHPKAFIEVCTRAFYD